MIEYWMNRNQEQFERVLFPKLTEFNGEIVHSVGLPTVEIVDKQIASGSSRSRARRWCCCFGATAHPPACAQPRHVGQQGRAGPRYDGLVRGLGGFPATRHADGAKESVGDLEEAT